MIWFGKFVNRDCLNQKPTYNDSYNGEVAMKNILVIEDDEPLLEITIKLLNTYGYQATGTTDSIAGLQQAREHAPDLVLCDLMLPGLDGFGVLKILRNEATTANIPFIFMSAKTERAAVRQGMELGADDYVTKPFTPSELLAAVNTRLQKHDRMEERTKQKLNELRERITFALPHEIRTPLNAIIGFSDLLVAGATVMEPTQIADAGQRINRSAWRLWRLVENYLIFAQIELFKSHEEARQSLFNTFTEHPRQAIEEEVLRVAHDANRQGDLSLDLEKGPRLPIAENFLRKIVQEIAGNAFKFSEPGNCVSISGALCDHGYCLEIRDEGRGMAPQQIAEVGAYMQFDRIVYEQQGAGLGLAIARDLTELHGGELLINSRPDKGTTVSISLPASADQ
ncbi:MAG TPA: hybrid sensor histidine kinase/response regulator [Aggregatilineales bacterium]|nr:hybrid sensor histidine kinase/response regulator [Aggregatilineales bacterium]